MSSETIRAADLKALKKDVPADPRARPFYLNAAKILPFQAEFAEVIEVVVLL